MSNYDLYRNTICKYDDNDYIILFKDDESAKTVFDEFNQKDAQIAELEKSNQTAVKEFAEKLLKIFYTKAYSKDYIEQKLSSAEFRELLGELLKERGIE